MPQPPADIDQRHAGPSEVDGTQVTEIVRAHVQHEPSLPLAPFERQLIAADADTHEAFQTFLQQQGLSSFARIVTRKTG